MTALTRSSKSTGSTMTLRGTASNKPGADGDGILRQVGDQHALLFCRALPDQTFAQPHPPQMSVLSVSAKAESSTMPADSSVSIW